MSEARSWLHPKSLRISADAPEAASKGSYAVSTILTIDDLVRGWRYAYARFTDLLMRKPSNDIFVA